MEFIEKRPDCAYIAERLWLPKSLVHQDAVKNALQFFVQGQRGQTRIRLWEESANHLVCPREFIPPDKYPEYPFPFVDLRPTFPSVEYQDLVVLRDKEQELAWEALSTNANGILNLGCGKGKTKLALKKIAQVGTTCLVVVPDGGILTQWTESILGNARKGVGPSLRFTGELGIIQGQTFNWRCPVTVALVTTLWKRIEEGSIPPEMVKWFGLIVYDEVHQIGAPKFSLTASKFYGDRIGLTATVRREDGLDPIYIYHIGEPFYTDLAQTLVPRIYFQQTPISFDSEIARMKEGTINISILRSLLGRYEKALIYRYWAIKEAVDKGRKILCLSHSKDQLRYLHSMFPGSALIVSETDTRERMDLLRQSRLCFAISRLGAQAVDDINLDTLFWLTPFRSKIALQQSMGRIQRQAVGKKSPLVVIFEEWMIPSLRKLCNAVRSSLRATGYSYETSKPQRYPITLPDSVKESYDRVKLEFTDEEGSE